MTRGALRGRRLVLGIFGCLAPAAGLAQAGSRSDADALALSVSGPTVVAKTSDGRVRWRYHGGGAVLAPPIALDSGRSAVRIASRRAGYSSLQVLSRRGTLIGGAAVSMGRSAPLRLPDGRLAVSGTRTGLDDVGTVEVLDLSGRVHWVYEHPRAVMALSVTDAGHLIARDAEGSAVLLSTDGVSPDTVGSAPVTARRSPPLLAMPPDLEVAAQMPLPFGLQKRFDLQRQQVRLRLGNQEVGAFPSTRLGVLYADSTGWQRWVLLVNEEGASRRPRLHLVVLGASGLKTAFELTFDVARQFTTGPLPLVRIVRRRDGGFGFDLGDRRFSYDATNDKLVSEPLS